VNEFLPSDPVREKEIKKALKALSDHPAWRVVETRMEEILQDINVNNYTPEYAAKQPTAGRFIHKLLTAVKDARKQENPLVIEVGK
jgi:hypothetical protein